MHTKCCTVHSCPRPHMLGALTALHYRLHCLQSAHVPILASSPYDASNITSHSSCDSVRATGQWCDILPCHQYSHYYTTPQVLGAGARCSSRRLARPSPAPWLSPLTRHARPWGHIGARFLLLFSQYIHSIIVES